MLGFLVGTVCLIGLLKMLHGGRYHGGCAGRCEGGGYHGWGSGGAHGGDWGGPGAWGVRPPVERFRWSSPRVLLRGLFQHLETTPSQEKVIVQALDELRDAGNHARGELRAARAELARAMRSPAIDEVLFGEMFARQDASIEALRKAGIGALAKVHDALDEQQRARLAERIASGPVFFAAPWSPEGSL